MQDTAGSSQSQQTYHGACGLKNAAQGCGRLLDQSEFRPMTELSSPVLVSPANAKQKKTSTSREVFRTKKTYHFFSVSSLKL